MSYHLIISCSACEAISAFVVALFVFAALHIKYIIAKNVKIYR